MAWSKNFTCDDEIKDFCLEAALADGVRIGHWEPHIFFKRKRDDAYPCNCLRVQLVTICGNDLFELTLLSSIDKHHKEG